MCANTKKHNNYLKNYSYAYGSKNVYGRKYAQHGAVNNKPAY